MELYARSYPDKVAGVVLVDSRHADFTRQCKLAGVAICAPPVLLVALMPAGSRLEVNGLEKTMDDVVRAGDLPDIPLVVLTSGKIALMGDKFQKVWLETQKSLATNSNRSTHTVCAECGHFIQKDAPGLVIDAVKSIIEQVRGR